MVSANDSNKNYPKRLFPESKVPTQHRSMNHNCHLVNVSRIRSELGEDVWLDLKNSPIGVISKFCEIHYTYWASIVHYFLTHQLLTDMEHELWSLIEGHPIRFSLHEFEEITQLNCEPLSGVEEAEISHKDFWDEIKVPESLGPSYDELQAVFPVCKFWSFEKRRMVAWLIILSVVILGVSHSTRIPLEYAKLVLDPERFLSFPWGRVAFSSLLSGVKLAKFDEHKSYVIRGFVHVLHIWALVSVPALGELYGRRREGEVVPLLSYSGSRPHFDWAKVQAVEKTNHGQLRVRNMVLKPPEEVYPVWEENEVKDPTVVELIQDILLDQVDERFWDEGCAKANTKKRKMKTGGHGKDCEEDNAEKKARKVMDSAVDTTEKQNVDKGPSAYSSDVQGNLKGSTDPTTHGLFKLVEQIGKQVLDMNENLPNKVAIGLDAVIDARIEARFGPVRTNLEQQIAALHDEVNRLREKLPPTELSDKSPSDAHSKESSRSNDLNQGAKEKKTNFEDIPLVSVFKKNTVGGKKQTVKKPVVKEPQSKGGKEEGVKKADAKETVNKGGQERKVKRGGNEEKQKKEVKEPEEKKEANDDKERKKPSTRPKRGRQGAEVKQAEKPQTKTKKVVEVPKGDEKEESDTVTDPKYAEFNNNLDRLVNFIKETDKEDVLPKRNVRLTAALKEPYVGNSAAKRVVMGAYVSDTIYEPLEAVDSVKFWELRDYVYGDDTEPIGPVDNTKEYYKILIAPRDSWPNESYGWLTTGHMAAAMSMFRKRSMAEVTPYAYERIEFVDPYFTANNWVREFKSFKAKSWECPEAFVEAYNGLWPKDAPSQKQWITDVDRLFAVHNVNENHWVALDIHLLEGTIDVYDSIMSLSSEKDIIDACMPFSKMLPVWLNHMSPATHKKKYKLFKAKRARGIPQNLNPGDCGVYTLKYIECLALGINFDGLCDGNMQMLREKLGAEMYNEVPEPPNVREAAGFGEVEDITGLAK